jgi:hypothetical protein
MKHTDSTDRRKAQLEQDALTEGAPRDGYYEGHPLVMNSARIVTPAIRSAYDVLEYAITHRNTGVVFVGKFRIGKTRAIETLIAELHITCKLSRQAF